MQSWRLQLPWHHQVARSSGLHGPGQRPWSLAWTGCEVPWPCRWSLWLEKAAAALSGNAKSNLQLGGWPRHPWNWKPSSSSLQCHRGLKSSSPPPGSPELRWYKIKSSLGFSLQFTKCLSQRMLNDADLLKASGQLKVIAISKFIPPSLCRACPWCPGWTEHSTGQNLMSYKALHATFLHGILKHAHYRIWNGCHQSWHCFRLGFAYAESTSNAASLRPLLIPTGWRMLKRNNSENCH